MSRKRRRSSEAAKRRSDDGEKPQGDANQAAPLRPRPWLLLALMLAVAVWMVFLLTMYLYG